MFSQKRFRMAALLLAAACSFLTGAAQLMIKWGVERLRNHGWANPSAFLSFFLAYSLLGLALLLLLLALRGGELSTIYPVLAARYVWVVALTPLLFSTESLNLYKIFGAGLAAVGVFLVAREALR